MVSSEHAALGWDGLSWQVRDLGSKNGTYVNGDRIKPGRPKALVLGDKIGFGTASSDWKLSDAAEPEPAAWNVTTRRLLFGHNGLLFLPGEDEPKAALSRSDGAWQLEIDGGVESVDGRAELVLDGTLFHLLLPPASGTVATNTSALPLGLGSLCIHFRVSTDEEWVRLELRGPEGTIEVPHQACLYTLLTLARHRRLDAAGEGWLHAEALARQLRCSREKLNLDLHRIRRLFAALGVSDSAQIVQRKNVQELRCGGAEVSVEVTTEAG